jgi:hypothetical protein
LAKFARFRHHNSPSAQLFRHVRSFIQREPVTSTAPSNGLVPNPLSRHNPTVP